MHLPASTGRDFGTRSVCAPELGEATLCQAQTEEKEVAIKKASAYVPSGLGFGLLLFSCFCFFFTLCAWRKVGRSGLS